MENMELLLMEFYASVESDDGWEWYEDDSIDPGEELDGIEEVEEII